MDSAQLHRSLNAGVVMTFLLAGCLVVPTKLESDPPPFASADLEEILAEGSTKDEVRKRFAEHWKKLEQATGEAPPHERYWFYGEGRAWFIAVSQALWGGAVLNFLVSGGGLPGITPFPEVTEFGESNFYGVTVLFDDQDRVERHVLDVYPWAAGKQSGGAECSSGGVCGPYLRGSLELEKSAKAFDRPEHGCVVYFYGDDSPRGDPDDRGPVPSMWKEKELGHYGRLIGFLLDDNYIGGFPPGSFLRLGLDAGAHHLTVESSKRRRIAGAFRKKSDRKYPVGAIILEKKTQQLDLDCADGEMLIFEIGKKSWSLQATPLNKARTRIENLKLFEAWADPFPSAVNCNEWSHPCEFLQRDTPVWPPRLKALESDAFDIIER